MPNLNFAGALFFLIEEQLSCIMRGTELWREFCVSQVEVFTSGSRRFKVVSFYCGCCSLYELLRDRPSLLSAFMKITQGYLS